MKTKVVGNMFLVSSMLFLASCGPGPQIGEGDILKVPPGGVSAWQMKQNGTGPDHCQIGGGQTAMVVRRTFWSPYTGASGDNLSTDLVQVDVENRGSCDGVRQILLTMDSASKLEKQSSQTSPEGGRSPGQTK